MYRKIILMLMFGYILTVGDMVFSAQTVNGYSIQKGSFICKMNNCIIYTQTEDDGEFPVYKIYALDLRTKKSKLIDNLIIQNCWAKISDTTFVYSKSGKLFLWHTNTQSTTAFIHNGKSFNTCGLGYNQKHNCLLLFDLDSLKNKLILNVLSNSGNVIFNKTIDFNEIEMEGLAPFIKVVEDYCVFSIQDKLYALDLISNEPVLHLLTDKCDCFTLFEKDAVLFYKFISDEKTSGFLTKYDGWNTSGIDSKLDDDISNCVKSDLFSTEIDGKITPVYIICGNPNIFNGSSWCILPNVMIFKDDRLIVKPSSSKQDFNIDGFQWNWAEN